MSAERFLPECPACQIGATAFVFCKNGYLHYQCLECEFLFVHPYPSFEDIKRYYRSRYASVSPVDYSKSHSRKWRAFWRSLRFFPYIFPHKKILDIGCGGGFMVNAFSRLVAIAVGVDLSEASIQYAKTNFPNCSFYCESIAKFSGRDLIFDFIFSLEVFEHLAGTADVMQAIDHMSRIGTFVYISTPDLSHPAVPKNIQEWGDIAPPEHLQFFSRKALLMLFERYGFELYRENEHGTPAHDRIFRKVR